MAKFQGVLLEPNIPQNEFADQLALFLEQQGVFDYETLYSLICEFMERPVE